jgi:tRNA modification GTPase
MINQNDHTDTIAAIATPSGEGAIGVIRISGVHAIQSVSTIFKGNDLEKAPGYTVHFGKILRNDGTVLDEVLLNLFRSPRSYTGEDTVEISCHGSPYIMQEVLQLLCSLPGVRAATPGEFTLRAFLNGKLDLAQAEAVADLIAAGSEKSHQLAMTQLKGGFSKKITKLREELIHFASLIELELDFSEEDLEFANRGELKELIQQILDTIQPLIDSFKYGNAIKNGIQTVLAGRPNAGKSTLLNALLNEDRAIVSDIAGTTRDTIEERLVLEGVEFRLIDTAGIREATDTIEALGVNRTMQKISESPLLIYIFDISQIEPHELQADINRLYRENMELLIVANQMDKNPYWKPDKFFNEHINEQNLVSVSALHQMNIEYLKKRILEAGIKGAVNSESIVVSNVRHYQALKETSDALEAALINMESGISGDLVAMDIRRSLHFLGLISGAVSTEDLLQNIFSRFCIGK